MKTMSSNILTDLTRSQIVIPFGVGGIYDHKDFSAITMNVDQWEYWEKDADLIAIDNPRFIDQINSKMRLYEGFKSKRVYKLLNPPIAFDANASKEMIEQMGMVTINKFPRWGVCSRCSALSKYDPTSTSSNLCNNPFVPKRREGKLKPCAETKRSGIIEPVRFIVYCGKGHLDDFPWEEFMSVHCEPSCTMKGGSHNSRMPSLYLSDDTRGNGFQSLQLACGKCHATTTLAGIQQAQSREEFISEHGQKIFQCHGSKPWSNKNDNDCDQLLDVQPRAASRIYSSIQCASIFIPDTEESKHPFQRSEDFHNWIDGDVIESKIRTVIEVSNLENKFSLSANAMLEMVKAEREIIDNELNDPLIDDDSLDANFFHNEYKTLELSEVNDDRFISKRIPDEKYDPSLMNHFFSLHKVKRLYCHTALLGFTRMSSTGSQLDKIESFQPSRITSNFIPGFENIGEGIFINFGYEKINLWLTNNEGFKKSEAALRNNSKHQFQATNNYFHYGHVMLHTFSHLLMNQLSIQCGYSLTELKERIYFDEELKMAGILIYTASADSSGSMGGLVRMIHPKLFESLVHNSITNAFVCSNDPICIDSAGQGTQGLCLAGCHACAMIPDLACGLNSKNSFLDRNALIGNNTDAKGYFLGL